MKWDDWYEETSKTKDRSYRSFQKGLIFCLNTLHLTLKQTLVERRPPASSDPFIDVSQPSAVQIETTVDPPMTLHPLQNDDGKPIIYSSWFYCPSNYLEVFFQTVRSFHWWLQMFPGWSLVPLPFFRLPPIWWLRVFLWNEAGGSNSEKVVLWWS